MTYFGRLLLSRGASSAALISNRKSRGEPRRRSRPIRGHRRSFSHRPRPRKNDRRPIPAAMFRPLPLPRHLHTPRETIRLLSATPHVASCHVVSLYRCETKRCRTILWPIRGFISRMMDDSPILFGPRGELDPRLQLAIARGVAILRVHVAYVMRLKSVLRTRGFVESFLPRFCLDPRWTLDPNV